MKRVLMANIYRDGKVSFVKMISNADNEPYSNLSTEIYNVVGNKNITRILISGSLVILLTKPIIVNNEKRIYQLTYPLGDKYLEIKEILRDAEKIDLRSLSSGINCYYILAENDTIDDIKPFRYDKKKIETIDLESVN